MRTDSWFWRLLSARRSRKQKQLQRTKSLQAFLAVTRLEERRVLNADGMPLAELVMDAGSDVGDSSANAFITEIHEQDSSLQQSEHHATYPTVKSQDVASPQGVLNDDLLIADFKSSDPLAGVNLLFAPSNAGGNFLPVAETAFTENKSTTSEASQQVASIDLATPVVQSVTPNDLLLTDADMGAGSFELAIVFDEVMQTSGSADPVIEFSPLVDSSLTFSSGSWSPVHRRLRSV